MPKVIPSFYMLRGLPGSGKSTLAKKIQASFNLPAAHFEADMFFTDPAGNYTWDANRIGDAHDWCQDETLKALESGQHTIVSNTTTRYLDVVQYFLMIKGHELIVNPIIVDCPNAYGSIHHVPPEPYERMKNRYENLWTIKHKLEADGFTNVVYRMAGHYDYL